ncbi:MAG: hypothetical protein R6X25_10935 [Candidatus Krumholzibacteriia bacterium]
MADERVVQGKMEVAGLVGPLWILGWLFTLGYVGLNVPKALWAVVIWPYYLGSALGQ